MICKKCGAENDNFSGFCRRCGSELGRDVFAENNVKKCPKCGHVLNESDLFCAKCGTSVDPDFQESEKLVYESEEDISSKKKKRFVTALVSTLSIVIIALVGYIVHEQIQINRSSEEILALPDDREQGSKENAEQVKKRGFDNRNSHHVGNCFNYCKQQ